MAESYALRDQITGGSLSGGVMLEATLASYAYTLGAAGNRLSVTEQNGRTVNYTYDSLYRLTDETITNDPTTSSNGRIDYTYDAVGNRLSRTSALSTIPAQNFTYDANDRLTSDGYDSNGNTLTAQGTTYSFDWENHLQSVNSGSVTYLYDGDGNRVAKTAAGVTTRYLIDTNNPTGYAQVVEELQGGAVTRTYTYGHDLISQNQVVNSQWTVSFYGYDGHGSTRFLTDSAGNVTDTYTYDAFGNLINQTGSTPNDYLYSGEQYDSNLGFYYLRARYLNPVSGRFQTTDTYRGITYDPVTLHKYLYANADPVNRVDPSGHESIATLVQELDLRAIITAMAVLSIATVCWYQYALSNAISGGAGLDPTPGQSPCVKKKEQELNRMRVQLQIGTTHLHAEEEVAPPNPGVTVAQMQSGALLRLFFAGKGLILSRYESDFLGAIARTSQKLIDFRIGGGVTQGGEIWDEEFGDRGVIYRVDLENLRGHNLRQ